MSATPAEDAIHREIANQLIAATPEWWDYARLSLTFASADGVDSCEHEISNPSHPGDVVVATDELMAATRALGLLYKQKGHPLRQAVYEVSQRADGQWEFKSQFSYA